MTGLDPRSTLRVGVVDHSTPGWSAGGSFTEATLRSLHAVSQELHLELTFLSASEVSTLPGVATVALNAAALWPGSARLRAALGITDPTSPFSLAAKHSLDVILPPLDVPPWRPPVSTVAWIPDLQHLHLPSNFSERDRVRRESICARVLRHADLVLASSDAVRDDIYRAYAPTAKVRVAPFPSLLAFERLLDEPHAASRQYGLPERYALVANQFWRHKNHGLVVEAVALLKSRGVEVDIVMTGVPADHRDPGNRSLSDLLQRIAASGVHGQVRLLGEVPPRALYDLIRTATLVIQPSHFEGWGTTMEDALTLGRPIMCSDLAVHREHAPASLGFFDPNRPEALADLVSEAWPRLRPGPDFEAERAGLQLGRQRARRYGELLAAFCREAAFKRR